MTPRILTAVLCGAVAVVLIAWDLLMATNRTPGDTISEVVRAWNIEWGGIPAYFAAGIWLHLWGPTIWR